MSSQIPPIELFSQTQEDPIPMPRKRASLKQKSSTKSKRKRSSGPTKGASVPPSRWLKEHIGGIPQKLKSGLVWNYDNTLSIAQATYGELAVIGNGAWEPVTGFGTSPTGFTKLMALYTKCFVVGYTVKVKVNIQQTQIVAAPVGLICGLTTTTSTASLTSANGAIGPGLADYNWINSSPDVRTFSASINVSKFLNKPKVLDDPQLFSTSGGNPSQLIVSHFWYHNIQSLGALTVNYALELVMDVVFTDPTNFA